MSNCSCVLSYHQFAFLSRPNNNNNKKSLEFHKKKPSLEAVVVVVALQKSESLSSSKPRQFIPKAASSSSASLTGSGAEYSSSGQLLGREVKQKRQKIAGIDQEELVDPALLADPDSCFCEFKGVQMHHKICDAETEAQNTVQAGSSTQLSTQNKKVGIPMILLHGFGASLFSWNRVMKSLAKITGSKVLAFDRPAFGLTSRAAVNHSSPGSEGTKPLNPYSMMFSVLATLFFMDFLAVEKTILVGHSAGSLVAVETYFEAPERVAALILVGPAIIAPLIPRKVVEKNQPGVNNQIPEDNSNSNVHENPIIRLGSSLSKFSRYVAHAIMRLVKGMQDMISSLYKKALSAFLRSQLAAMLVRMVIDKFGITAIRNSWYDSNQITDHVLQGYTKPLRTKGWDRALLEFTAAMFTESASESKPPLAKRLNEISCPVLIITGDSDRLVPSWNAERLSKVIPRACFEVIKNCGHLPQEEKPEEFLSIVDKYTQRVFGGIEAQPLQAAI
ncbi:hypothetical protein LguiB_003476 [Lonicera macranthoides]